MTFDEIQRTLEQMLAVQRELQESQLNQRQEMEQMLAVQRELQESQLNQRQEIVQLLEYQLQQQRLVDRLIGYSITTESDHLDLEERI
jgi:small-conductance mechanosensitive channel